MKKGAKEIRQAIAFLEEIADDIMETDVHTGINLRRISTKIVEAFASHDIHIDDIDTLDSAEKVNNKTASYVKEAVKVSRKNKDKL